MLLVTTISFGFIKQGKVVARSWKELNFQQKEPGFQYLPFKEKLLSLHSLEAFNQLTLVYVTDRESGEGKRPAPEYRYDAQYALAPIFLRNKIKIADYYLLDFENKKNLNQYLKTHDLETLLIKDSISLAKKRK